ncbi:roadblock/LC7 domain-containing protein [Streptomyces aureus]|uniref:roadblock/LC7 domain-containing protein n=1 Tax=Streptomyces aureus TaxID=193461 RepID=UPI000567E666|nr:roadblock/LC7 domain-containing protein [Streptomyces aureus]
MTAPMTNELGWMLDEVLKVPQARHAILLSADGMLRAHSADIARDDAERLAAGLSGVQAISRSTAEFCGSPDTPWRQTLIEFAHGYVFLVAAGEGTHLAVSTTEDVDMEAVAYRMHKMVDRLGKELTSPARQDTGSPA